MTEGDGRLAILFPGQGVGDERSRELVAALRPDLLALATELVGEDPFARIADGTRFAQPVVYLSALAGHERLGRPGAHLYAGHSLGEVTALAAAGVLAEADGLRVVVERGRLMDEAARAAGPGGMLALGCERERACRLAERHGLTVANENSPRQFVLSGAERRLAGAEAEARELGLRAKRLAVAGAFHSPAMEPAVEPFRELLGRIRFRASPRAVVSGVTAAPMASPAAALAAALTRPVRWIDVLARLHAEGARRFLDVGPGRVLAGLVKRTLDGVTVESGERVEVARA